MDRNTRTIYIGFLTMTLMLSTSWSQSPSQSVYSINAAQSRIELAVSREGMLKAIGHDHTIQAQGLSGEVRFNPTHVEDSSISLSIDAESLVVLEDPKLSEKDRKEVQANMQGAKVLDIRAFPKIEFHSTRVSGAAKGGEDFTLTGRLMLHGVQREIAFPVRVRLENNVLRATGVTTIAQTDFGIKPFKGALGTLRLKDQIKVAFDIAASKGE